MRNNLKSTTSSILTAVVMALLIVTATPETRSASDEPAPAGEGESAMTVTPGKQVSFAYTLTDDEGTVIDTSEGGEPFVYIHGRHDVVPGLESELAGMKVGESKDVTVVPEDGYGVVREDALLEVPLENIPEEARVVGTRLQGAGQGGQPVFPVVKEVREEVVVLDFNHPLAGQTLHFKVEILAIESPTAGGTDAGGGPAAQE